MKINRVKHLLSSGNNDENRIFNELIEEVKMAIGEVRWPEGSEDFTINTSGGKHENGVRPIKNKCMEYLERHRWRLEQPMDIATQRRPGKIDAIKEQNGLIFALEWETGNISSSHRALNKMSIGFLDDVLSGGILILPSSALKPFITDRVGNFPELEPYFSLWESLNVSKMLAIIEIEHDRTSDDVPFIPKGKDGNAPR